MLKLGKGFDRKAVRKALAAKGARTVRYDGVLRDEDIREAVAGIRDAGNPLEARPILAWLASHPNAPEDVLRELGRSRSREVLMSLCLNKSLPADMRKALLSHKDLEVRRHANHVFSRSRRH